MNNSKVTIRINHNKTITKSDLFANNEYFHQCQAKLTFAQKIDNLVKLQKIDCGISKAHANCHMVWDIQGTTNQ